MFESLLQADISALTWARGLIDPEYACAIQIAGESIVVWIGIMLVGIWLYGTFRKENSWKQKALNIFGVIVLTFIIHACINLGVPQWRLGPQDVVGGIKPLIPHPIDNSFPSGHALFTTAALMGIYRFWKNAWIIGITILLGLITASARVIGGVHYPGDILGGWMFGALGGYIFSRIILKNFFQNTLFPLIIKTVSFFRL